jgi:hypothetical protein
LLARRKEGEMPLVLCQARPGADTVTDSVAVRDTNNVRTFLSIDRGFVTKRQGQTYLPIGVVYKDREKGVALIAFPVEADSGAHRIWVPLTSVLEWNGDPA